MHVYKQIETQETQNKNGNRDDISISLLSFLKSSDKGCTCQQAETGN